MVVSDWFTLNDTISIRAAYEFCADNDLGVHVLAILNVLIMPRCR